VDFPEKHEAEVADGLTENRIIDDCEKREVLYRGIEPKFGITLNNKNYIVKLRHEHWNNVLSEHVSSRFINECGIPAHNTFLGVYKNDLCVMCEDFSDSHGELHEFGNISSSFDTDKNEHDYFFSDVLYMIQKVKNVDFPACKEGFMFMFLMDAILGNPDRHMGNWGLCKKAGMYKFAPIYDNGASLFPRADIENISEEWMRERCMTFPNSKIMFGKIRKRSDYREVVQSGIIDNNAVEYVSALDVLKNIDNATQGLSVGLRRFYRTVVWYRFRTIIKGERFIWKGMI
jgi:hypothetical protein